MRDTVISFLVFLVALGILVLIYEAPRICTAPTIDVQKILHELRMLSPDGRKRVRPLLLKALRDRKISYHEEGIIEEKIDEVKRHEIIREIGQLLCNRTFYPQQNKKLPEFPEPREVGPDHQDVKHVHKESKVNKECQCRNQLSGCSCPCHQPNSGSSR